MERPREEEQPPNALHDDVRTFKDLVRFPSWQINQRGYGLRRADSPRRVATRGSDAPAR